MALTRGPGGGGFSAPEDDEEPAPEPDDPSTAPSATGAPDAGDDAGESITVSPNPQGPYVDLDDPEQGRDMTEGRGYDPNTGPDVDPDDPEQITQRGEPGSARGPPEEDTTGEDSLDVTRTGLSTDPDTDVADQVTEASEENVDAGVTDPEDAVTTDEEFEEAQSLENDPVYVGATNVADTVSGAAEDAADAVTNPFDAGPLGWIADNLEWVAVFLVGLVTLYLLRPALTIVASLTEE